MIAKVVVNSLSKQTDKKFDYLIPEGFVDISIGSRVVIPFGRSNKHIEGYVMGISNISSTKKLKSIISFEKEKVFDEKMLELVEWMREKYLCTYIDALRVIVPSGTDIKLIEYFTVIADNIQLTKNEKIIFEFINNYSSGVSISDISISFENINVRSVLNNLIKKGAIKSDFRDSKSIKDKTVRIAKLTISPDEVYEYVEKLEASRAISQARVLKTLASCNIISVADLVEVTQSSYNAVILLKKRGLVEFCEVVVSRSHIDFDDIQMDKPPKLTDEQQNALDELLVKINSNNFCEALLHGVTGSGKTEVFLNSINSVINNGRQAIVLVPEISLTPQMMNRFIKRFGKNVAILHSGLSLGERYDEWKKIKNNEVQIVIGARSAIFAPFNNVGIIIMDEEHEASYKSEMNPRYTTGEVAEFRAKQMGAVLLKASATPDINTYYKAVNKKIDLLQLKKRVNKNPIPKVSIVDMRQELQNGNKSIFSVDLLNEIKLNLEKKEQTILFMNRRGFSTFVSCRNCGFVANCPNCNISLTYHKFSNNLKCHYCGYERQNYTTCPICNSRYIRYFGGGTQKVEEEIKSLFPDCSTIRMDVDTTSKQNSHEKILDKFEKENIDILIGTQMVAKGLDFPNVTLVGVVSCDTIINLDDFRAGEKTFDLLEQVTGRAGRAGKLGRAIIQTYSPDNEAVNFAKEHNYIDFYNSEIAKRKVLWYPPFSEMVTIIFSGLYENMVSKCSKDFAKALNFDKTNNKVQVLGPVPCIISKINNKYRFRIIIKCENADLISENLVKATEICESNRNYEKISIIIDKNPNNTY